MRLINTKTGEFVWVEDPRQVRYAILSHVWAQKGDPNYVPEQTYQDVRRMQESVGQNERVLPLLSEKIRMFCEIAHNDGFEFGWIDTCCIDKSSSSELSEAINSMYNWYRYAGACYAILHDVSDAADVQERREQFRSSKWFTRGWTLQELLAPSVVLFLSDKWRVIGSKHTLAPLVESVTGIERRVLTLEQPLEDVSVARRMSWAASRETTREEDEAYSLMGIFGVNMPTTYGEGRYAFIRLQEEILKYIPDQTIFAWGPILSHHPFSFAHPSNSTLVSPSDASPIPIAPSSKQFLLASSPKDFKSSAHLVQIPREDFAERLGISPEDGYQVYTTTSYGIHARFPLVAVLSQDAHSNFPTHLALLACEDSKGRTLALLLRPQARISATEYFVGTIVGRVRDLVGSDEPYSTISTLWSHYYRTTYLSLQEVHQCLRRGVFETTSVYIPHRPSPAATGLERDTHIHAALREARDAFEVRLSGWSRKLLMLQGYRVSPGVDSDVALRDRVLSRTLSSVASGIVISNSVEYIAIQVGRCNCEFGGRFGLLGVLVSSRTAFSHLEDQFAEEPHFINHPVHIHSWAFRCGVASKEITLDRHTGDSLTVRLTFTNEVRPAPHTKAYRLGVEIWSAADAAGKRADRDMLTPPARWRDDLERTFPMRRAPHQPPDRAATYFVPPVPVPPPQIQRLRSNSAPYVPAWVDKDELHQDGWPQDSTLHLELPHTQKPTPALSIPIPSPPLSAESPGRNDVVLRGGYASDSPPPRDLPQLVFSRERYDPELEGASRPKAHSVEVQTRRESALPPAGPTHGAASTRRWADDLHPRLSRPRSMEGGLGDSHARAAAGRRANDTARFARNDLPLPGHGRRAWPPERRSSSEEEADYHPTKRRRGLEDPRKMPVPVLPGSYVWEGDVDANMLGGGSGRAHIGRGVRSESPDPMTSSDERNDGGNSRRHVAGRPAANSRGYTVQSRGSTQKGEPGDASTVSRTSSVNVNPNAGRQRAWTAQQQQHWSTRNEIPDRDVGGVSAPDRARTPPQPQLLVPGVPTVRTPMQRVQREAASLNPVETSTRPSGQQPPGSSNAPSTSKPANTSPSPPPPSTVLTIGASRGSQDRIAPSRPSTNTRIDGSLDEGTPTEVPNGKGASTRETPSEAVSPSAMSSTHKPEVPRQGAAPPPPSTTAVPPNPSSQGVPITPTNTTKKKGWRSRLHLPVFGRGRDRT